MTSRFPVHPVDKLSADEKCRIYYSRVVDLAVFQGLLLPDPDDEIGHFAFSKYYFQGQDLDTKLRIALRVFEEKFPELILLRRNERDRTFLGTVEEFYRSENEDKLRDLIVVGASHKVWPIGTSFTLTYPWDLAGTGQTVRFRDDLTDFMKRRIVRILKSAGKLRTPDLFVGS
ncbi:MAG TPA: hypothetical protein VK463_17900 [Desulfomonilaceae bacterium]|nr:hypothetical protein [Desulfomonilaceae bacterium]